MLEDNWKLRFVYVNSLFLFGRLLFAVECFIFPIALHGPKWWQFATFHCIALKSIMTMGFRVWIQGICEVVRNEKLHTLWAKFYVFLLVSQPLKF